MSCKYNGVFGQDVGQSNIFGLDTVFNWMA